MSWQAKLVNLVLRLSMRPSASILSMANWSLYVVRYLIELLTRLVPSPRFARFQKVLINGVKAEWVTFKEGGDEAQLPLSQQRVIIYLHGGGYFFGSSRTHRPITTGLAKYTGNKVLSVNYRLVPEFTVKESAEDAIAVFDWLLSQGYQASNLTVGGDSAGGGLTLIFAQLLKQMGRPMPAALFCLSPFADMTETSYSLTYNAKSDAMFHEKGLRKMMRRLGEDIPVQDPMLSPVFADFTNFPPLLLQVGTTEMLLDDSRRIAANAREYGVDVTLSEWEGMPHVFALFADVMPEGKAGLQEVAAFVVSHVANQQVRELALESNEPTNVIYMQG